MTFEITPPIKNLIAENIPLHDIIQGVVLTEIIEEQKHLSEATGEEAVVGGYEYHRGYTDAMQKVYGLVYSLIFEKEDQLRGVKNGN
jgi:hypothetical protein